MSVRLCLSLSAASLVLLSWLLVDEPHCAGFFHLSYMYVCPMQALEIKVRQLAEELSWMYERVSTGVKDCFGLIDDIERQYNLLVR